MRSAGRLLTKLVNSLAPLVGAKKVLLAELLMMSSFVPEAFLWLGVSLVSDMMTLAALGSIFQPALISSIAPNTTGAAATETPKTANKTIKILYLTKTFFI